MSFEFLYFRVCFVFSFSSETSKNLLIWSLLMGRISQSWPNRNLETCIFWRVILPPYVFSRASYDFTKILISAIYVADTQKHPTIIMSVT
jgi:hypothetical protein